jgi:hypothetical protein
MQLRRPLVVQCPLLGIQPTYPRAPVKPTSGTQLTCSWTNAMSAFDPKRTWCAAIPRIDRQSAAVIVTRVPSGPLDFSTVALS